MRFALITGDETPADLREIIANLREKQRRSQITSVRDELNDDINEVFELLRGGESDRLQPDSAEVG